MTTVNLLTEHYSGSTICDETQYNYITVAKAIKISYSEEHCSIFFFKYSLLDYLKLYQPKFQTIIPRVK